MNNDDEQTHFFFAIKMNIERHMENNVRFFKEKYLDISILFR